MAIKARIGAGEWDILVCDSCSHLWHDIDIDHSWSDEPEDRGSGIECPSCSSSNIIREERG